MTHEKMVDQLFEALINGDRIQSRRLVDEALAQGVTPEELTTDVFWPTYEMISRLFRADQLSTLSHHMATRLLRVLCDQATANFRQAPRRDRSVFTISGPTEFDEVAAQMASDLLEREGLQVTFAGGGIALDEILAHVQSNQPHVLMIFASAPGDLPMIRELIDSIHEIGACRALQIAVGGGVFNRAEGLAVEIGADLWAASPMELVESVLEMPAQRASAEQRTVGRKRVTTRRKAA
ncbi:MAG: B12-binding domain-containing protein [Phycisphaerales bacterium]|nr:B12-binding domain-containing protein [Phycisphaerales bacterium]